MNPKTSVCVECYSSFVPNESKSFCDKCVERLRRDMQPNRSVEDDIVERRFIWNWKEGITMVYKLIEPNVWKPENEDDQIEGTLAKVGDS